MCINQAVFLFVAVAALCRLAVSVAYEEEDRACHARARARDGYSLFPVPSAWLFLRVHSFVSLGGSGLSLPALRAFWAAAIR